MVIPYTLLIIKPMSVGRGDAPQILEDILNDCPVSLRKFKAWSICETTLFALTRDKGLHISTLDYEKEQIHPPRQIPWWVCLFTHLDRVTDPTSLLEDYCGPLDSRLWGSEHLRWRYGGLKQLGSASHPTDNVVHITAPERREYEANILFMDFNEEKI